eukprot:scaffold153341_cov28-Tisochrysis_lutea.AAC.2
MTLLLKFSLGSLPLRVVHRSTLKDLGAHVRKKRLQRAAKRLHPGLMEFAPHVRAIRGQRVKHAETDGQVVIRDER